MKIGYCWIKLRCRREEGEFFCKCAISKEGVDWLLQKGTKICVGFSMVGREDA